jgi:hypothetical protein
MPEKRTYLVENNVFQTKSMSQESVSVTIDTNTEKYATLRMYAFN